MAASSALKTKQHRRSTQKSGEQSLAVVESAAQLHQAALQPEQTSRAKSSKTKLTAKKRAEAEELGSSMQIASSTPAEGAANATAAEQPVFLAQTASSTNDASGYSASPQDLKSAEPGTGLGDADATSEVGLSTSQMVALGLLGALGVGGVAVAVSSSNSSGQSTSQGSTRSIVADGYIKGAQIYLKTPNGLQILEGVITDENGVFYLPNGANPNKYPLIAVGGVNTDTGIPQTTPLTAPAGSTTINPLTTLMQAVIDTAGLAGAPLSVAEASSRVAQAFGLMLPSGVSLANYDPLAGSDATSLAAQKVAAQIATMIESAASCNSTRAGIIQENLANLVRQGNPIDLSDIATLGTMLVGTGLQAADIPTIADRIATANRGIADALNFDDITQVQSSTLDTHAPFPVMVLTESVYTMTQPVVRIKLLNLDSTDGSAPVVGDRIEVHVRSKDESITLYTTAVILTKADLQNGYVDVTVNQALPEGISVVTASILDKANHSSNTNELSQYTSKSTLLIDTGSPNIESLSVSSSSGSLANLAAGDVITLTVRFDEPVSVSGTPSLLMHLNGHDIYAALSTTQDNDYNLIFTYTVKPGESGQLAVGKDCIQLNDGSIVGAQNDAAELTLQYAPLSQGGLVFTRLPENNELHISEDGPAASYSVALSSKPTTNVTLVLESSSARDVSLSADGSEEGLVTLVFTPDNWNAAQSFYVSATKTNAPDAGSIQGIYARTQSDDPAYDALLYGVNGKVLTVTETADTATNILSISQTGIDLTDGDITNDAIQIHLNYQPTKDVTVTLHGTGDDFLINGTSTLHDTTLVFTPQNWSQDQTVLIQSASSSLTNEGSSSISIMTSSLDDLFNEPASAVTVATSLTPLSEPIDTPTGWLPALREGVETLVQQITAIKYPLLGTLSAESIKSIVDGVMADLAQLAEDAINLVHQPGNEFLVNTGTHEFYVRLSDAVELTNVALAADLGFGTAQTSLLAFNLDADASVHFDYDLVLEGGWDANGLYFDAVTNNNGSVQGSCLLASLNADFTGEANGHLGPLTVYVVDQISDNTHMAGKTTGVSATVNVYLLDGTDSTDGILTQSELGGLFTGDQKLADCFSVDVGASGQLSLGVTAGLDLGISAVNAFIPNFSFDLNAPFAVGSRQMDVLTKRGDIYLDHMTIGLGDFVNQFVAPVVNTIDPFIQFLAPIETLLKYDLADSQNINIRPYEADLSLDSWGIGDFFNPFGKVAKEYLKQIASDFVADFTKGMFEKLDYDTSNNLSDRKVITILEILTGVVDDWYAKENSSYQTAKAVFENSGAPVSPEIESAYKAALAAEIGVVSVNKIIDFMDGFNAAKKALIASGTDLTGGIDLGSVTIPFLRLEDTAHDRIVRVPDAPAHEGSGGQVPEFLTKIVDDLNELGFDFPILTDGTALSKILTLQSIDLVTFTPDIPDIHDLKFDIPILNLKDLLVGAVPALAGIKDWIPLTGGIDFVTNIDVESNLSFGVDTSGLNAWFADGMQTDLAHLAKLADGFFVSDNLSIVNGQRIDLPEASASIDASIQALLGFGGSGWGFGATGSAAVGADANIALDLVDGGELKGTSDGNVHLSEILNNLDKPNFLDGLASTVDLYGSIDLYMNAALKAYLNLSDNSVIKGMATADKWLGWLENIPVLSTLIGAGGFIADLADVVPRVDVNVAAASSHYELPYAVL